MCARVCVKYLEKLYEQIWLKFCGELERDPGRNRLDVGGGPVSFVDPGLLSRILYH